MVLTCILLPAAFGRSAAAANYGVGLYAGVAHTNISDRINGETLPRWLGTLAAGLDARPPGSRFGLRLEATYLPMETVHIGRVDSRLRLDWLQIPLLLRAVTGNRTQIEFVAGPAVSLRLRAWGDDTLYFWNIYVANIRWWDLALVSGVAITRKAGRLNPFAEGLYSLGLVNLDSTAESTLKSRAISIRAGVMIRLP
jgi:hypothetical protein